MVTFYEAVIYAAGFGFSTIGGGWGTRHVLNAIEVDPSPTPSTPALGYVETTIYTAAWLAGQPAFIPVWLGLKVLQYWRQDTPQQQARRSFNRWLTGAGLSLLYGVTGGQLIQWAKAGRWDLAVLIPVALVLATAVLGWRVRRLRKVGT